MKSKKYDERRICFIGTSQLKIFMNLFSKDRTCVDDLISYHHNGYVLDFYAANSDHYYPGAYEISGDGNIVAREEQLRRAWNFSSGRAVIEVQSYDYFVLFGFRGVGNYTFSRSEISVFFSRNAVSEGFLRRLIEYHVENNTAVMLLTQMRKSGAGGRAVVVEEPLYGRFHHSLSELAPGSDLWPLKHLIDEKLNSAVEAAGGYYMPQADSTLDAEGATTRPEYLLSDHFHMNEDACKITYGRLMETIRNGMA
ncbi:hypothetical protein M8R20_00945 [Pseudomonas sp. R2.Fl]|nr:hypothetical protein [Pseudomonas sp. R2.Fl]